MNDQEIKSLAGQLRNPSGEEGVLTGEKMFETNGFMIKKAIDELPLKEGDQVLEMGYGNGAHLDYLFQQAPNLSYKGVDISETMQQEATRINKERVAAGTFEFLLGDGINIPLKDATANAFFTVNTIYFWEDHAAVIQEIMRVLKPGGSLCISFSSRNCMEKFPFTKHGFKMFHPEEVSSLLQNGGFHISRVTEIEEELGKGVLEDFKTRELVFVVAQKPL